MCIRDRYCSKEKSAVIRLRGSSTFLNGSRLANRSGAECCTNDDIWLLSSLKWAFFLFHFHSLLRMKFFIEERKKNSFSSFAKWGSNVSMLRRESFWQFFTHEKGTTVVPWILFILTSCSARVNSCETWEKFIEDCLPPYFVAKFISAVLATFYQFLESCFLANEYF